jgi:hypothetical protein
MIVTLNSSSHNLPSDYEWRDRSGAEVVLAHFEAHHLLVLKYVARTYRKSSC